jgi:uncharacterized cupin superfamily protein
MTADAARDGLPVANMNDVLADPALTDTNGPRGPFHAELGFVGKALGTRNIGVNVTVVPAGRKAWPRHFHYGNDELFVVLAGRGTLHYGERSGPIGEGDVIAIEAGTGIPFQIENTSDGELRYLAFSTLNHPDVFVYPDSDKIGIMAGGGPMREAAVEGKPKFVRFVPGTAKAGYWDGETED